HRVGKPGHLAPLNALNRLTTLRNWWSGAGSNRRPSAFQAWRNPSSQRNVQAWRGAAALRCQRLAAAVAVTVAVGRRGLAGAGTRGEESASIDPGLVAVAVSFAQRLPGLQPLRPHPLTVIQVGHPAAQRVLAVWPEELHAQDLPPGERGERVGAAAEP